MALPAIAQNWGLGGCAGILLFIMGNTAQAQLFDHCTCEPCPKCYEHCTEGPPKIKFKCGCPKPVCDPCSLKNWGYYENHWQPWPYAPNFSRCFEFGPPPMMAGVTGAPPLMSRPDPTLPRPRPTTQP